VRLAALAAALWLTAALAPVSAVAQQPTPWVGFFSPAARVKTEPPPADGWALGEAGAWPWERFQPGPDAGAVWQLSLRSQRHSDALPLARFGDDVWSQLTPRPGRNLAYLDEELRLARRSGAWSIGLLARSQATLVASRESLELARIVDSGQRPPAAAQWAADVQLTAFSGVGLALARDFTPAPGWTAQLSAQALSLLRWRDRRITGPVAFDAGAQAYSLQLQSDEIDDRLVFPYQQAHAPRGAGLLLGAALGWRGGPWTLGAALLDGGWLRWRGVPQQQASLDSGRTGLDADGFLLYGPLIEGRNRQQDLTRRLSWRGRLTLDRALASDQTLGLTVDTVPGFGALPALDWRQRRGRLAWGLGWRVHERRLTLGADWQGWTLRAGADRLDASARSREWVLGYAASF
jgi:hypothetical protein